MGDFPNTGSLFDGQRTNSGLSTQIIVKVNNTAVGALQNFTVNQARPLKRINEIGTDGNIEIVPQSSPTYDLAITRIVFDQLRVSEAFSRAFRFIGAQRIPFDIEVFDMQATPVDDPSGSNLVVMTFKNCWFTAMSTPYGVDDYTVVETATIWAETAFVSNPSIALNENGIPDNRRGLVPQLEAGGEIIERATNQGNRRGALDAAGILNSLFE